MRNKTILLMVLVCLFSTVLTAQARRFKSRTMHKTNTLGEKNSRSLPIRRVILYSNGVAYIERRGIVSGNAKINLSFKQSQVDDVLKSMIVLDLGKGKIGSVSYNSSAPPSSRMAKIPFSVGAKTNGNSGGIGGVLSQLQGAEVLVVSTRGSSTGAILNVEKRQSKTQKGIVWTTHLVIASKTGQISNYNLADIKRVKLLGKETRNDINEFANAAAASRRRDAKSITVTSNGVGQRELVVSYTVAAPIWKTTYRVVLDDEGKPFFQGWAIIDNVSEEDWKNVKLSLISGSPVSFIQNLQKPLYRYRPVIPIPEDLNLDPQIYEAGSGEGTGVGYGSGSGSGRGRGRGIGGGSGTSARVEITDQAIRTTISQALLKLDAGIVTAATGNELGDLFEYKIDQPVTVRRNRSALIPIVQTKMEGKRVSIYNEQTRKDRPMSGMILTNTTPLTFEGGSMTVLDRNAYVGEALMERLKPKEKRLISFAVDLGTLVTVKTKYDRRPAQLIKAVKGTFQVHYFRTTRKSYNLVNQTNQAKTIWIEHQRRNKWLLSKPSPKPEMTTKNFYRFKILLEPFAKKQLVVSEKQGLMDSYQLSSLSRSSLNLFIARKYVSESTKAKLEKLLLLRMRISGVDSKVRSLKKEESRISLDQKRLRGNIKTLTKTAEAKQLIVRYIQKIGDQETRIEQITRERRRLIVAQRNLRDEMASEIRSFEIAQNLN